jgi:RNA polymerase sigma factor (sigma-70 family)
MKRTTFQPRASAVADARDCILLDDFGRPLNPRLTSVLVALIPRFRRTFNTLRDDATIVDVIEEAGRRIAQREARFGPVDRLHSYAWVTLVSAATSLLRRGPARLEGHSPRAGGSARLAASLVATTGTAEQIERAILIREMLDQLPQNQRLAILLRLEGFTLQEIADRQGSTTASVNMHLWRARWRLRELVRAHGAAPASDAQSSETGRTARPQAPGRRRVSRRAPAETVRVLCDHAAYKSDERFHSQVASD